MEVTVETEKFSAAMRYFAAKLNRGVGETVKEQSRLLAENLRKLTPPANAKQGKNRVEADIKKVYLANEWFEQKFAFRNIKLKERIVDLIQKKDSRELNLLFFRSVALSRLEVEQFNRQRHERGRDSRGRVKYRQPVSFPVSGQGDVAAYTKQRQKAVGLVKGGWGQAVADLGGKSPAWLRRSTGGARDYSSYAGNPHVILFNRAPYAAALSQRMNIVSRALAGRAKAMTKSADKQIAEAKRAAGL